MRARGAIAATPSILPTCFSISRREIMAPHNITPVIRSSVPCKEFPSDMHEMSLNEVAVAETAEVTSRRFLPLLLLMFVSSGCSALIYEIVWFQLLELVIGSSTVSLGILLGTFMGGMCLGSLALSRLVSARRHPLLVYGTLELGIAASAIVVL